MILWLLPLLPLFLGFAIWIAVPPRRGLLAGAGLFVLAAVFGLAVRAAVAGSTATLSWGAGVALSLAVEPRVSVMILLVPLIAAPVVAWAAGHEAREHLPRLIGLLVAFAGAMELLVLANDLVALAVGFELVGALSWALIGHRRKSGEATRSAVYAFNVSRIGGLGLLAAAGAALAEAGSFAFDELTAVAASPWGSFFAAGVLVAAASKSAQVPFSPWLFRAMDGPSSASALLHSSTMVAAGAWVLIRLHEPLALVSWLGPVLVGLGLLTACAGGVVALVQPHAKRLLAASTSAHYGLVFAAVGAGSAGAGLAHLVTHAGFKALLFLAAGTAIAAAGSESLREMRLGRVLPWVAAASAIGALALAGAPPLGGAWSKEKVVAAAGEQGVWLAVLAIVAGGLSAGYAARFHLLAYGEGRGRDVSEHLPGRLEYAGLYGLAVLVLVSSALWIPSVHRAAAQRVGVELPEGKTWELVASLALALAAVATVVVLSRREDGARGREGQRMAAWLGLPAVLDAAFVHPCVALAASLSRFDKRVVDAAFVHPSVALAASLSRFDDRVVDAGIRGAARIGRLLSRAFSSGAEGAVEALVRGLGRLARDAAGASRTADDGGLDRGVEGLASAIGGAARGARRTQSGALPAYYLMVSAGLGVVVLVAALGR